MSLSTIDIALTLPDLWQQDAVRRIQNGQDVVVDAPTGAGKTYIFELAVRSSRLEGQSIFTVPTRALANDKLLEWREKGWNVGIATGDVAENLDAPVIVATLETQKYRLLHGEKPKLIVIDEYQMIADPSRGVNYEMVLAIAPRETQLLLLSGSVKNPQDIVNWLKRIGRNVALVSHKERPVPQEQIYLDTLTNRIPKNIYGYWPRYIGRALSANLEPILIFAPQRKDSERIALQIASCLPLDDPLELSPEQKSLAGDRLSKLLKTRVAYHHSGLSYKQRAGVIEPLAKMGQLRVVVATTGLGAGINFSMRSVIITDREFRQDEKRSQVRPDELLQMFGRAGRRGLDERGYVLVLPEKPRLEDAEPIQLRRTTQLDWPSFLAVMYQGQCHGRDPALMANQLAGFLFTDKPLSLGFKETQPILHAASSGEKTPAASPVRKKSNPQRDKVIEILASTGNWERRRGPIAVPLGETLFYHKEKWIPSTEVADALKSFDFGSICIFKNQNRRIYGKEWIIAHFPRSDNRDTLLLSKKYRKVLRETNARNKKGNKSTPTQWKLERLESHLRETIPVITSGAQLESIVERNGAIAARIDFTQAQVFARKDSANRFLFTPPEREVTNAYANFSLQEHTTAVSRPDYQSPALLWQSLGLIDENACPTRRGVVFSFFNHGEGLAVAAALEDRDYPIEQLVWDIANLRAGHRFDQLGDMGNRLSFVCRETYGSVTYPGYLKRGLPEEYGEGGAELVCNTSTDPKWKYHIIDEEIKTGDVERVILEWKSILRQIANAPEFPWDRWLELQLHIRERLQFVDRNQSILDLPPLTAKQRSRKLIPIRWI
jgi:superfamily II DNA/RNA helicase